MSPASCITFSSALDPATAQNASNYSVIQMKRAAGHKRRQGHFAFERATTGPTTPCKLTLAGKPRFAAGGQTRS